MALKGEITKLEDVPENVRPLYVKEGEKFVLDVEGLVPKAKVDEFRNNNVQLQQQLDKLKDIDPVKYHELTALQRKIDEKELLEKGEVEKVVNLRVGEMKTNFETQIGTLQNENSSAKAQLAVLLIDNAVRIAAAKNGVVPTAIDDVVLRARSLYVVDKGAPVPKNEKGEVVYGKDGTTPMPMDEWLLGLKKNAPHLFVGSQGSGAGGGRGNGHVDTSKMTPAQKIQLGINNGGLSTPASAGLAS